MQEHARSARAHVRERQAGGEEHFGMWPFHVSLEQNDEKRRDSEMRGGTWKRGKGREMF